MKLINCMIGLHEFDTHSVTIRRCKIYSQKCKKCGKEKIKIWKSFKPDTTYVNVNGVWKQCINVYERIK